MSAPLLICIYLILAGGLVFLSDKLGNYIDLLDKKTNLSGAFLGGVLLAAVTSLPELFTSVSAARKGNDDIAVGNILGSNIFNILFIVGLSSLMTSVPFDASFLIDSGISLVAALLIIVYCIKDSKIKRWAGILMLSSYVIYFIYLLL